MARPATQPAHRLGHRLQIVTFRLGREIFGVAISYIQEVLHLQEITEVPGAPAFIDGVIDLRNSIVPVVDLKRWMGIGAGELGKQRIVILDIEGRPLGVVVDDISEVLWVTRSQLEALPEAVVGDTERNCVSRLAKVPAGLIIVLDPTRILSGSERRELVQFDPTGTREDDGD